MSLQTDDRVSLESMAEASTQQAKVFIHAGQGYVFDEIFAPIIDELASSCQMDILLDDYFLSEKVKSTVKSLKENKKINSYAVFKPKEAKESLYSLHKRINHLINELKETDFDLMIIVSEQGPLHKYLIRLAQEKQAKIVLLQVSTIWRVLDAYHRNSGISVSKGEAVSKGNSSQQRLFLFHLQAKLKRRWRALSSKIQNYLYPILCSGAPLSLSVQDKLGFATGLSDVTICYDPLEFKAIEGMLTENKSIILARHPAYELRAKYRVPDKKTKKILVAFGGNLMKEMPTHRFQRWVAVIHQLIVLTKADEIVLRFHPRTSSHLTWPKQMEVAIQQLTSNVSVQNVFEDSLVKTIDEYIGILASPSGTLRVARAVSENMFVLGLPNCADGSPDDQNWILGEAEGIRWIEKNQVSEEDLQPINVDFEARPSVAAVIKQQLEQSRLN